MDKLGEVLAELAKKFGTTADQLWQVMIAQARVEAIIYTIQFVLIIIGSWYWIKKLRWTFEEVTYEDRYNAQVTTNRWRFWRDMKGNSTFIAYGWLLVVPGVILVFAIMVLFFDLPNYATAIFNPQYWALKNILGRIH